MRVAILGPLQVVADGQAVEIGGARLRALLTRLAVDAGRVVTVDSLSQALWPEGGPVDRAHALQALVSRLRRVLPSGLTLRSVPGGYHLDVPPESVDAWMFERLVREGQRALRDGQPEAAAHRLREALGLWRGEALADMRQEPYTIAVVARLDELWLTATEGRVQADLAVGAEHLVAELEELTAAYPLREPLRSLLIKALHADGRRAEALSAYEKYRRMLADEFGADPGQELQDTHLMLLRSEQPRPERGGARPRGNLRAPLTSFVGRAEERARVTGQLREGRLVTLVGPGGAGKTRLATTVAAELAEELAGEGWLVELATVTDPGEVPQAVVNALGLREARAAGRTYGTVTQLVEALSVAPRPLLVLDNCEHVIEAAARLIDDLLGRCPKLRVLATSREPLGILGEALCVVPPLPVPGPGTPAEQAMTFPAVRLFADRASAVHAGFTVTDSTVDTVAEVCHRLDGLPLAIELAAAKMRSMSVEHLAARLDDRFRLLTGGSRTALSRHRTLRAVVAWSWDLLDAEERRTLERLAVSPSSFDTGVAEHLGALQETVDALVDKSLVQLIGRSGPRYRMLETIREYGLERLAESGELTGARAAHAAYYLELAERAEPQLRGGGQLPWLGRLAAERDNLLAALHFACDTGDADTAVRLGAALWYFWAIHSEHAESAHRLRVALDLPGEAPVRARTAATAGYLFTTVLSGGLADAETAEPRPPEAGQPLSALIEATLGLLTGDAAAGLSAIDRRQPDPDPWLRAMLSWTRSFLCGNHGDRSEQCRDLVDAAAGFRAAGERWGLAMSLTNLAMSKVGLGDMDGGVAALEESVALVAELGADDYQRLWLAIVRFCTGDADNARADLLDLVERASSSRYVSMARLFLGELARRDGDFGEASRQFELAGSDRGTLGDPTFQTLLLFGVGHLAVAKGELEPAARRLREALAMVAGLPDLPMAVPVGAGVAELRLRQGAAAEAARVLGASHALRGMLDAGNLDVIRLAQELRDRLGEPAYQAAYADGRGLDRAGALALIQAEAVAETGA